MPVVNFFQEKSKKQYGVANVELNNVVCWCGNNMDRLLKTNQQRLLD